MTIYTLTNRVLLVERRINELYCYIKKEGGAIEKDPIFITSPAFSITQSDIDNWNNATVPEQDTLDTVTTRDSLTNNPITIGGLKVNSLTSDNTYTKNIIAKPDGTFGIEDKAPIITTTSIKEFYDDFTGTTLTLSNIPKVNTIVNVIENGVVLREGATRDYTISGAAVTLLTIRSNVNIEINYTH